MVKRVYRTNKDGTRTQIKGPPEEKNKARTSADIKHNRNLPEKQPVAEKKPVIAKPIRATIEAKKEKTIGGELKKKLEKVQVLPMGLDKKVFGKELSVPLGVKANMATALLTGPLAAATKARQAATTASYLAKVGTRVNVNAIGKAAGLSARETALFARRVGSERINILARYAVNSKSTGLTKNWLVKAGLSLWAVDTLFEAFGTYPWASHNEREATDTLTFGMREALNAGDLEEYDRLSEEFDEMVNKVPSLIEKLPYTNVITSSTKGIQNAISVKQGYDSIREKLVEDMKAKAEEPTFAEERAAADKEARERQMGYREEDTGYYADIEEKNRLRKVEETRLWNQYYDFIRQKRYNEAEQILKQIEEME